MAEPHTRHPRSRISTAFFIGLLISITTAAAIGIARFKSWDDLTQNSPDIIIARCTETPKSGGVANGMIWADIEVVSVLKGDTKPGAARMVSQYSPQQGQRFLMFSTYQSNEHYRAYNATEEYRVVPIGPHFPIDQLTGKPLAEQIRTVLRQRLEDLKRESEHATEEKKRLEAGLAK